MFLSITHNDLEQYLSAMYDTVNGYDFYKFIFPNNESTGELNFDFSKPNAIYLYTDERDAGTKRRLRRRIMLDDTWEDDYMEFVEQNPLTLCSGLSYRRRANKIENAQKMNALIFDLDGVGVSELKNLLLRFDKSPSINRTLPMPTFLVVSGTGVHIYYVFDEPIDLYPNIKLQLKSLKYSLTFRIWEYTSTSTQRQIQYQSINQGFRMVGSVNDKYGTEIKAFRLGDKVSIDYLNSYVRDEKSKVDISRPFRPSTMTREQAAEAYPDWYARVVVNKNKGLKKWKISQQKGHNGDELYRWWIRQAEEGKIKGGHRYFFLMCMSIYACKCDVPKKQLRKDMKIVFEHLKSIDHTNPLSEEDIESALEAYDKEYYNFTINDIEKLTDVRIDRNKRNYRKQDLHLRLARGQLSILKEMGEASQGRPSAQSTVEEWQSKNPQKRKADCIRDTGLDKKTVYKWWREV